MQNIYVFILLDLQFYFILHTLFGAIRKKSLSLRHNSDQAHPFKIWSWISNFKFKVCNKLWISWILYQTLLVRTFHLFQGIVVIMFCLLYLVLMIESQLQIKSFMDIEISKTMDIIYSHTFSQLLMWEIVNEERTINPTTIRK